MRFRKQWTPVSMGLALQQAVDGKKSQKERKAEQR